MNVGAIDWQLDAEVDVNTVVDGTPGSAEELTAGGSGNEVEVTITVEVTVLVELSGVPCTQYLLVVSNK